MMLVFPLYLPRSGTCMPLRLGCLQQHSTRLPCVLCGQFPFSVRGLNQQKLPARTRARVRSERRRSRGCRRSATRLRAHPPLLPPQHGVLLDLFPYVNKSTLDGGGNLVPLEHQRRALERHLELDTPTFHFHGCTASLP